MSEAAEMPAKVAMVLHAIELGHVYGYSIMEVTGLPSGTVYPALRRLEMDDLITSRWEKQSVAQSGSRPPRRYYRVTRAGELSLEASKKKHLELAKTVPAAIGKV